MQVDCLSSSITGPQQANTVAGAPFTASITLLGCGAPTIAKAFGAPSIVVNGTTTLTFTLTNPNAATALTGVGFTDTLPAGLVVATPNGLANTCGGTVTAAAGSGSVALASGGLAVGGVLHDHGECHRHHGRPQEQHHECRHVHRRWRGRDRVG